MIFGDDTSHVLLDKLIKLLKAGDYDLWDQRIELLGKQNLYYFVGYRPNREAARRSITIESKNHRDLSDNDRSFKVDASDKIGLFSSHWWEQFTDEEWEFFSNFNFPFCHDLKLYKIHFSLYE